ncbi:hypothetical protein CK203_024374 [Vitis vinifera]|uniref:Uncharacterized protein n=1 Tax=Vitis vinifera TaxID=29760 RepID=A0A438IYA2_VITVI|nr:hypothetical protein CK203_024374 [Vitis vinifera]
MEEFTGPSVKVEKEEFLSELGAIKGRVERTVTSIRSFSIILDGGGMTRGLTPFRFENMWLKGEVFKEVLRKWWEGLQISGTASYILSEKLKALKPILKKWNTEVFGQIKVKKQEAWNSLDFWDKEERVRELSSEEEETRKEQERCIRSGSF